MELTQEHHDILSELTNSDQPIFLTGAAGTGKTTLIKYWLDNVRKCCIKLAPTGIAALNLDGETIHSFFRFPPNLFTPNQLAPFDHEKFMRVDVIVIDEVSMCLGVLIDCIDSFLRQVRRNNSPFGGIKIIFTGDLFQLPPIVPKSDDFDGAWFLRTQGYKSEWQFPTSACSRWTRKESVLLPGAIKQPFFRLKNLSLDFCNTFYQTVL